MWLVDDDVMNRILDGDYKDVVKLKQDIPNASIRKLFFAQGKYKSYVGFNKFYRKVLCSIIDNIIYIDDNSLTSKLIRLFIR